MKNFNTFSAILILLCFFISGCELAHHHEKENVSAVYWHEANRYSVAISDGDMVTIKKVNNCDSYVKLFTDVPVDESSWYSCDYDWSKLYGCINAKCEIHINNIDQLRTGDWNHGKFGTGATARIN